MPFQMEVIDDETHNRELCIFTRCAIECEGSNGTTESPEGSINFASWFATGENYVICKVKRGVNISEIFLAKAENHALLSKNRAIFSPSGFGFRLRLR